MHRGIAAVVKFREADWWVLRGSPSRPRPADGCVCGRSARGRAVLGTLGCRPRAAPWFAADCAARRRFFFYGHRAAVATWAMWWLIARENIRKGWYGTDDERPTRLKAENRGLWRLSRGSIVEPPLGTFHPRSPDESAPHVSEKGPALPHSSLSHARDIAPFRTRPPGPVTVPYNTSSA